MTHWTRQPDVSLAGAIGQWCFSNDDDDYWLGRPIAVRPGQWVDVCISVPESGAAPWGEVIGLKRSPLVVINEQRVENILVQLRPWVVAKLFRTPASELTGCCVDLSDLFAGADGLLDSLASRPFSDRQAVMEGWLKNRLFNGESSGALLGVTEAVRRIEASFSGGGGGLEIGCLCREMSVGERLLQRLFRDWVGVSPKAYACLIRYCEAERRVSEGHALLRVAMDLGFADQAHLSREFKRFAGVSPSVLSVSEGLAG